MKLLCDTNVLLDVVLHREPFFQSSFLAVSYCEDESVDGLVADVSLADMFYIVHHAIHDNEKSYGALELATSIFQTASPSAEDIEKAIKKRHRDFEDCLLAMIAEKEKCDYVITRNTKDFEGYSFQALTPDDFNKIMI